MYVRRRGQYNCLIVLDLPFVRTFLKYSAICYKTRIETRSKLKICRRKVTALGEKRGCYRRQTKSPLPSNVFQGPPRNNFSYNRSFFDIDESTLKKSKDKHNILIAWFRI